MESESTVKKGSSPIKIALIMLVAGSIIGLVIGLNFNNIIPQEDNKKGISNTEQVSADDDPYIGSIKAPLTLIEFSDFQCPFCRNFFNNTLPEIKRNYVDTGKIRLVYRDFPISSVHKSAQKAAEASECADEQGKFWEYHDILFNNQKVWEIDNTTTELKNYASALNLDINGFSTCLDSGKYSSEVANDIKDGAKAGITGTPTFFINDIKIVGAQPYDYFKNIIEAELNKK